MDREVTLPCYYPASSPQEQLINFWRRHNSSQNIQMAFLNSPFQYTLSPPVLQSTPVMQVVEMNAEDTAEWIRKLGWSKGWKESEQYAESFRNNKIMGYLLEKLTLNSLKSELDVVKYGHRIEILTAIEELISTNNDEEHEEEEYWETNGANAFLHAQEVRKWVNPGTDIGTRSWNSINVAPCAFQREQSPTKNHKGKSKRARPGNQLVYKVLHSVPIKSGKSFSSPVIGQLLEDSIVIINQTKGRRGRLIMRNSNGEFVNVGWVPIFTNKGHLLLCHWRKGEIEVKNSDAVIKWSTKSPLDEVNAYLSEVSDSHSGTEEEEELLDSKDETLPNDKEISSNSIKEDSDTDEEISGTTS